ncbi:MAG: hypothetical protein N5P05_002748 [Chroococcopsis gigantea SAG 12.99]|nr:hypothetical protein [Chroococcopsis gigantea SAG 12.99]
MPEQVNFVFRYQPRKMTKYGILLKYIGSDGADMSRNDRILRPAAAFWLPFAYQSCADVPAEKVRQIARSAVYQLKLHIQYLEESFALNKDVSTLPRPEEPKSFQGHHNGSGAFLDTDDFQDEDDILSQFT